MTKRINNVLKEMLLVIVVFGVLFQVIGVFVVGDLLTYAIGLWIGIILSGGMAIHMYWALETGMEMGEHAKAHVQKHSVIRYAVVVIVFFVLAFLRKNAIVPCFLGLMTLKVSAYLQPYTHKLILKVQGNQDSH